MRKILLASTLLGSLAVAPAWAGIFVLDQVNLSGISGPYVQVDVELISGGATITFDALTNGGNTYDLLDGGSAAVNVNGPFTLADISGTHLGSHTPFYTNGGAGNEDGFGSFNLTINSFDGWASRSSEIVLRLDGTWASADDVLTDNASGYLAAAHIGYGDGISPASLPAPEQALQSRSQCRSVLLGGGLVGIGLIRAIPRVCVINHDQWWRASCPPSFF